MPRSPARTGHDVVMPVYTGELSERRDPKRLPAVVTVDRGLLLITSGRVEIGQWKMTDVRLEEYTKGSVLLQVGDEELILFLDEHARFLADTAPYRRKPDERRRGPSHPAFQKGDEGPTLGEELKKDVGREVSSVVDEARHLLGFIKPGPPLWIGLGVFVLAVIVLPGLVTGLLLLSGVLALAVGAVANAEAKLAVRIPDPFTPTLLMAVGGLLILLGLVVAILR
jgi:hypothetical protein